MPRKMLPLALVIVAVLASIAGRAEPLITLNSVTVDLPDSGRMFPGPGSDASTTTASPVTPQAWC